MWAGLINSAGRFLPKPSKMWKSGLEGRQTSADKTTPKLVTEQLRASQKVLNKSDQFIPVVPGCAGWSGERTGRILAVHQWEWRLVGGANERAVWDGTQLAGPPATNLTAPNPLLGWKFKPWCRVQMFFLKQERPLGRPTLCGTLSRSAWAHFYCQQNFNQILLKSHCYYLLCRYHHPNGRQR